MAENPYRLARDIRGIGFRTADSIANRLGIAADAPIRLRAGLQYALLEATNDGHCGLPTAELLQLAAALDNELADSALIADQLGEQPAIFLGHLHRGEASIAESLLTLREGQPPWQLSESGAIDPARAIPWVEQRLALSLAESQRAAVAQALASKVLVITGGPGVGKTTLIKAILQILSARRLRIQLRAPTGRAAKRISETTGLEARTIHRLLEFDPASHGFRRNAELPLECDLLVVDETSMVDVPLMASLLEALPESAALLLVGDVDQLPSVGPGQVLGDLIASGVLPVARLPAPMQ